jgi:SAM-dependent methyltransferase
MHMTAPDSADPHIPTASHVHTNAKVFDLITQAVGPDAQIVDFGSGLGHMADRVARWIEDAGGDPAKQVTACDLDPDQFRSKRVKCIGIPPDSTFPDGVSDADLVYSIEVMEHLPRPYDFFDNAYAALKPGGCLLVTTPNLLHMTARMGLLFQGYQTMFAPPSAKPENAGRISGHIMPLGYGQIHAGLRKAGFVDATLHLDRAKRGSVILYWLYWPWLKLGSRIALNRLKRLEPPLYEETGAVMEALNGRILSTSRSCIVLARKPL